MIEREQEIIDRYLGIPYKHLGRDPKEELDCWGLIKCVYRDLGCEIWDPVKKYSPNLRDGENHLIENYHKEWDEIVSPHIFDVALFNNSCGVANHAGIVLSQWRFIHCGRSGVIVSKLSDKKWLERKVGFYRLKKNV